MNIGDELPEMQLARVPKTRSSEEELEYANNVLMSARLTRGLSFCDVLRQLYGDEDGRKRYDALKESRDDLSRCPEEMIKKIITFH